MEMPLSDRDTLIEREDVLAFDPLLVKRLRRLRDSRQRPRTLHRQISGA